VLCSSVYGAVVKEDPKSGGDFRSLVRALINAGVPSNERTVSGSTAADMLIHRSFSYNVQHQSYKIDEWLGSLEIMLNSGGNLNSVIPRRWSDRWNYKSSKGARFLLTKVPHGMFINWLTTEITFL
jgi:hypothetical protein